jgi:transposase InsO family protein
MVLKVIANKEALTVARAILEVGGIIPFHTLVFHTDQGGEFISGTTQELERLVGARYGYNNKGSHEESSVIERSILETRRHLTPILETLLEEFGNQEDWFLWRPQSLWFNFYSIACRPIGDRRQRKF